MIASDREKEVALRTRGSLAGLRKFSDGDKFDGSDLLTVFPFFESLRKYLDDADLREGDVKHIISYLFTGEAARLFKPHPHETKRATLGFSSGYFTLP